MERWTVETFAEAADPEFRLALEDGTVLTLELVETRSLGSAPAGTGPDGLGWRQPFSLLFQGPPEPLLPQRIYPLHHAALGELEIFLVPVGSGEAGIQYQAVFS